MEYDRLLGQIFAGGKLFSPDPAEIRLSERKSAHEIQPELGPVNVSDGHRTYAGYRLMSGRLPIKKMLQNHSILILTKDYTFIHIDKDKTVVTKKDNQKIHRGTIVLPDTSQTLEKDKPFALTLTNYPNTTTYYSTSIRDIILYQPPDRHKTTRRKAPPTLPEDDPTNLSTLLLRQFLK